MNLIIPSAGQSSRFPTRPKWLLTNPSGNLMFVDAISNIHMENIYNIYITVLKEHIDKYCDGNSDFIKNAICYKCPNIFIKEYMINVLILDNSTNSQCETVVKTIEYFDIKGPIFIKDVDNIFECYPEPGNFICYIDLKNYKINNVTNKSFIELNNIDIITNIVEKKVISDKISVGGYGFENSKDYVDSFYKLLNISKSEYVNELYTSHIIWYMMTTGSVFKGCEVLNYSDWGTYEDWLSYKSGFRTLFLDIDGILVKNSTEYFYPKWGESDGLENNIKRIQELYNIGKTNIILTTSRKKIYEKETKEQLNRLNIPYNQIVFDLFHCKRYLINDYSITNPYPVAEAINCERDCDNLNKFL